MNHDEPWQIFRQNGEPDGQRSISHDEARRTHANVGAVHVWVWCRNQDGTIDVFLQRRSQRVKDHAGLLDISFAGHIDAEETPLQAAKREAKEEVGYDIDVSRLVYIFGYRNFSNGTKWEYLYQVEPDVTFVFDDGEVSEMKRIPLEKFITMAYAPESHELVPHQPEYYSLLIKALQYYSENH
jgi:8-oxo-dGTP pyrophosphatase MutT (NUDIX family)